MTDRSLGAVRVTATRIGRTDLGAGSAIVDDDALTVMVRAGVDSTNGRFGAFRWPPSMRSVALRRRWRVS